MRRNFSGWSIAVIGGLALIPSSWAHPPSEPLVPGGHPTGHVADKPPGMTWPPQPIGITDVHDLSDYSGQSRRQLDRESRFSNVERQFSTNDALRPLAGRRMSRLSIEEVRDKATPSRVERRYNYFDRQLNATVTVIEGADGRYAQRVTPASQSQPELSRDEMDEAVALAKAHFAQRNMTRAKSLQGFVIQAYPPNRTGTYDGRVVYVSLHVDSDSPPEYVAWVDLTRQSIVAARQPKRRSARDGS